MAKSILQQASKCQQVLCVMSFFEGQRVETGALKITLSTAGRLILPPLCLIEWQKVKKKTFTHRAADKLLQRQGSCEKIKWVILSGSFEFCLVKCSCMEYWFRQNMMWQWPCALRFGCSNIDECHSPSAALLICISVLASISSSGSYRGNFNTQMHIS